MRKNSTVAAGVLIALITAMLPAEFNGKEPPAEPHGSPLYRTKVAGILTAKCGKCHGKQQREAELDLGDLAGIVRGSESGAVVIAGNPGDSRLIEVLAAREMPPEDEPPLTAAELTTLREWVEAGVDFDAPREPLDQHDIQPIMWRRCTMCHGNQYQQGGLDLRTPSAMLAGGKSGPGVVIGNADASLIIRRAKENLCPPAADIGQAGIEPITVTELGQIAEWINTGATVAPASGDRSPPVGHLPHADAAAKELPWSFAPIRRAAIPSSPAVEELAGSANPIDRFLARKLADRGMTFSPEASKHELLRRVYFDLTGLPPRPADVRAFLADRRPDAYQRVVDRLLASPRYGERWGRHWLDLAGYADSEGKRNADTVRPWAWRYRDYVIRSLNDDKPYDVFLREQVAGDEMVDYPADGGPVDEATLEKLIATGFLRMAPDGTSANPVNRVSDRVEVIADELDVLGRGVLGLTLNCARCHSHKYDPISQREYYEFVAIFRGAYDEYDWMVPQVFGNQWKQAKQRFLELGTEQEWREYTQRRQDFDAKLAELKAKQEADAKQKAQIDKQIKALQAKSPTPPQVRALWDRGQPSPAYVYRRGDDTQPTQPVTANIPAALAIEGAPFQIPQMKHGTEKTGRRTALANWLVHPDNPLVARVAVNRVWYHHFGTGIVKSVDNFGALGTPPSHPELLDWLAGDFQDHGWSFKRLHRTILTSRAYRQSSRVSDEQMALDPDNRLVSRMPLRRLSAEEVRDTILYVSGKLSLRRFGQPDPVVIRKDGLVTTAESPRGWRRSVYVRQRRKEMPTILEAFDLPQMNPNCVARAHSTVVSQPLYLWNSKMVYNAAHAFADDVQATVGSQRERQVEEVWLRVIGRRPNEEEQLVAVDALMEIQKQWEAVPGEQPGDEQPPGDEASDPVLAAFCHTILNSAAALFVD